MTTTTDGLDDPRLRGVRPVLDAEAARGNPARLTTFEGDLRGGAPYATVSRPLDPDQVEADVDLGPRLAWWPRDLDHWDLVERGSGVQVRSGDPGPRQWLRRRTGRDDRSPVTWGASRRRAGWVSDDPEQSPRGCARCSTSWPRGRAADRRGSKSGSHLRATRSTGAPGTPAAVVSTRRRSTGRAG